MTALRPLRDYRANPTASPYYRPPAPPRRKQTDRAYTTAHYGEMSVAKRIRLHLRRYSVPRAQHIASSVLALLTPTE